MSISPQQIEAIAPDQASLKAAVKLVKPAKWPMLGKADAQGLFWGECQGSGANPYRVMVDGSDLGSKCTCPSRKFPCKHALALMLMRADGAGFEEGSVPEWVAEWMGRRRKSPAPKAEAQPGEGKSLAAAKVAEPEEPPDPKAAARREAARARREAQTKAAIRDGLTELEGWVADQLRTGLSGLMAELTGRCRQIAARLVDAKAGALASRVDELPARVLALPQKRQIDALVAELGSLVLMARAWGDGEAPEPGLRRQISVAESREALMEDPDTLRVTAAWEVLATRERTRRDGLVAQSTWLMNLGDGPRFALLQDFFPASAGRRSAAFDEGSVFGAELVFYPARHPLRAQITERREVPAGAAPTPPDNPLSAYAEALAAEPWLTEVPLLLPTGRLGRAADGAVWWQGAEAALPVHSAEVSDVAFGVPFDRAVALWDGHMATLLVAETRIGRMGFHG